MEPLRRHARQNDSRPTSASAAGRFWIIRTATGARSSAATFIAARNSPRDLGGKYIFGDNVYRTVWALDETTTPVKKDLLCVMPKGDGPNSGSDYTGLSSFGTDADGEIYFCQMSSIGGRIYTLAARRPAAADASDAETAFANRRVRRPGKP